MNKLGTCLPKAAKDFKTEDLQMKLGDKKKQNACHKRLIHFNRMPFLLTNADQSPTDEHNNRTEGGGS